MNHTKSLALASIALFCLGACTPPAQVSNAVAADEPRGTPDRRAPIVDGAAEVTPDAATEAATDTATEAATVPPAPK